MSSETSDDPKAWVLQYRQQRAEKKEELRRITNAIDDVLASLTRLKERVIARDKSRPADGTVESVMQAGKEKSESELAKLSGRWLRKELTPEILEDTVRIQEADKSQQSSCSSNVGRLNELLADGVGKTEHQKPKAIADVSEHCISPEVATCGELSKPRLPQNSSGYLSRNISKPVGLLNSYSLGKGGIGTSQKPTTMQAAKKSEIGCGDMRKKLDKPDVRKNNKNKPPSCTYKPSVLSSMKFKTNLNSPKTNQLSTPKYLEVPAFIDGGSAKEGTCELKQSTMSQEESEIHFEKPTNLNVKTQQLFSELSICDFPKSPAVSDDGYPKEAKQIKSSELPVPLLSKDPKILKTVNLPEPIASKIAEAQPDSDSLKYQTPKVAETE